MPHAAVISGRTVIMHVLIVVVASAALCSAGAQDAPARPAVVGAEWVHVAVAGDSWTTIGAREGITPAVLAARNGRTLKSPLKGGDIIVIDNRHIAPDAVFASGSGGNGLIVNVPQRLLFVFADGRLLGHHPIAVGGRDWQTPLGAFTIVLKKKIQRGRPRVDTDEMRAPQSASYAVPPGHESAQEIQAVPEPRQRRHSWHECASQHLQFRHARMHQAPARRHRSALRPGV